MPLRFVQVNVQAVDPSRLGRYWAEAVGWEVTADMPDEVNIQPAGFTYPDPSALVIDVVPVQEPKTAKNRIHLDLASLSTEHQGETMRRLQALGAVPVDIGQGDVPWAVLSDPEGNEFFVLDPRPLY